MFDFDRRLSRQLRSGAERIDMTGGDVGSVMARGRKRQRRFQTAVAGTAFLAGAGLVAGLLTARTHPTPHTTVELGPGTTTGSAASLPAHLVWHTAPATSGLATAISLSDGAGAMYAVSTAPGLSAAGNARPALYRSSDGATWEEVPGSAAGSASIAGVFAGSDVLYTVATGPAEAAIGGPGSVRVSTSTDKGATFKGVNLPLDLSGPAHALQVQAIAPEVAAGAGGVVVAVAPGLSFDLAAAEPAAASAAAWAATPTGVEVLGPENQNACGSGQQISSPLKSGAAPKLAAARAAKLAAAGSNGSNGSNGSTRSTPSTPSTGPTGPSGPSQVFSVACYASAGGDGPVRYIPVESAYPVTARYTWSHLGISPQAAQALQAQLLVFQSTDGSHFTQVSIPASVQGYGMQLAYGSDGYAIVTDNAAILSADGRTWSAPIALPSASNGVFGAGYVNGHLTVVGSTDGSGNSTAAFVLDGASWTTTPLPVNVMSVSFGPLGVAAVGFASPVGASKSQWSVTFSPDGTRWSTESLNALSAGTVAQAVAAVGPSTVVVTVTRPSANPTAVPATPSAQVAVIGTPAG